MFKFLLVSCFIFISSLNSFAQKINLIGNLINEKDSSSISYVSIKLIKSNTYFDTDEKGFFSISSNINDTLFFSCIGFNNFIIAVKDFESNKFIQLKEIIYELDEVIVKSGSFQKIGIIDEKQTRSFAGEQQSDIYEITTLIEVPDTIKEYKIATVYFKQMNFSEDIPLRLHIYSVGENGLPDKELLKQQIIFSEKDHYNGVISINVKNQNIIIEKASFFIGLQWIKAGKIDIPKIRKNDIGIGETSMIAKRLTYHRGRVFNYQWYSFNEDGVVIFSKDAGKPALVTSPLKGNPINVLASAQIEVF